MPVLVERGLDRDDIAARRARACAPLAGRVLEIGFGSGLNLAHLPAAVTSIAAVEPSDVGWARSVTRRAAASIEVERIGLDAARIDADDDSVDAALSTFSLCTISDVALALAEVQRIVRPGGTFAFLEHGLADEPSTVRWQRRLAPMQRACMGGCDLTRDIEALVRDAGFLLRDLDHGFLPGPPVHRPFAFQTIGVASVP